MKVPFAILLAVGLGHAAPALAQSAAPSPLLGSWAVDVERLPMPPEARPKSVTISYADIGGGKWRTSVDIVGKDYENHTAGTYTPDGTPYVVEGSPEADIAAVQLPAPNVLVMVLGKGGIPASTRVYTVAPDGKTMIETAGYIGEGGKPVMRTNYFTRVR
ncbi:MULTISPECIES: hypothetical protein [unclassified Sphingomonas]|uniref:hypothetical protein n=1 Tax=Sphingomonas TaxID=13687 RepID=UPI00095F8997|nr:MULTISPECIES: hypothetical protein [unclassified Sphingomonas]MBN8812470.1 hypothetical protein [Sphingomonas sp.]OJY52203.1 MAG: hypothetical protein BGP17_15430 [Sphingomonas sp. 67-41]